MARKQVLRKPCEKADPSLKVELQVVHLHEDSVNKGLFHEAPMYRPSRRGFGALFEGVPMAEAARQEEVSDRVMQHGCPPVERHLYTAVEAARSLAVSRTTVYALMGEGELAYVLIGSSRRIPVAEVRKFVVKRMAQQGFTA